MKMYMLFFLLLVSFSLSTVYSQSLRAMSMAGITLSLKDSDNSFDPYDMSGNISFLFLDETTSWLKISPSLNSNWGDYKRPFDAEKVNLYGLNFSGLKTLGSDGTFIGTVSYLYDSRINVSHSVRYNTYQGSAFFINDSTNGNIRYNGPAVKFGYSFELLSDLYLGASGGYKILNGLKEIYSQTSTVLRDVDGSIGITYKLFDSAFLSGSYSAYNTQESLTTELPNPVDDEIYNFHGDTYNLTNRGNPWLEKIKEIGNSWSSQFYFKPDEKSEAGLNFVYSNSNQKVFFQRTVDGNSVLENEDGYSYFNDYLIEIKGRYDLTSNLTLGLKGSWLYNSSWSKISAQELLIWDWNTNIAGAGLGASYSISPSLLLSVEYNYSHAKADSSKYIDYHFSNVTSNDHIFRLGAEYEIFSKVFLRGGGGYGIIGNDIIYGGTNIKYGLVTFGLGFNLFESFSIDVLLDYNNYKPRQLDYSHSFFNGLITLKLFNI
jgi:opacity protein-like surface antigen